MPNIELANHSAWLESARRSHARRAEARRARRRRRGGRSGAAVAALALTLAAGGAVAAERTGGASPAPGVASWSASTVKAVQRALRITVDGAYGPQTRRAVRRFQRRKGIAADGVAGPATLRALGLTATEAQTAPSSAPEAVTGPLSARLQRIAACESGGNPTAVSADGRYRGKYQFSRATWRAVGGTGDPAKATEAEQDHRAAILYRRAGSSPWPNCG